ncbi:MAG TPA: hypothetical protein PK199_08670 [Bacteroidales bacterium]|nr:hypothetical protein [Bacteroidales bacterium]
MKKISILTVLALVIMQSCIIEAPEPDPYGRDGRDGRAFFKMNYGDWEPDYIEPGGVIPDNFYWDTYYNTSPGFYTVYYEYVEHTHRGTIVYPYEIEIEVFVMAGEQGGYRYDGKDGDDVYFELILFPDGYDYYHDIDYKSESTQRTQIGYSETTQNNMKITTTYYKLPTRTTTN